MSAMHRGMLRRLAAPALVLVTALYLVAVIYVSRTSSDWRHSDTLAATSGLAFFIISTLFAISLERRAEEASQETLKLQELMQASRRMQERLGISIVHLERDLSSVVDKRPETRDVDLSSVVEQPALLGSPPPVEEAISREFFADGAGAGAPQAGGPPTAPRRPLLWRRALARIWPPSEGAPERRALEEAIQAGADETTIRALLARAQIYALGQPATGPGGVLGEESELLHFTVGDEDEDGDHQEGGAKHEDGEEQVFLPVFTRLSLLRNALARNPEWKELKVLQVDGGALLDNVDPDVTIVIDPWITGLEYQLPPRPPSSSPPPAAWAARTAHAARRR